MNKINLHNALVQYFKDGCKPDKGNIGLECEHFIVHKDTLKAVDFYGENGVEHVIKELADRLSVSEQLRYYSEGFLIGFRTENYLISLEPGAQVEISIDKSNDIDEIESIYNEFYLQLTLVTKQYDYLVVNAGYQPASKVSEISLLPKERYKIMDKHFENTGSSGINMMRGTGAVHVSIDYEDEQDFVLKYRLANLLVPIFSLITENVAVFEGKELTDKDGHLRRMQIWADVDNERCGTIPSVFDEDFGFVKYADYIMGLKPLFLPTSNGNLYATGSELSADELFTTGMDNLVEFDIDDVVFHLLSMTFVDVRLKQYIEIRCADSMPIEMIVPYAEMIQKIFSDKQQMLELYDEITAFDSDLLEAKQQAISETIKNGFHAVVYGREMSYWLTRFLT